MLANDVISDMAWVYRAVSIITAMQFSVSDRNKRFLLNRQGSHRSHGAYPARSKRMHIRKESATFK